LRYVEIQDPEKIEIERIALRASRGHVARHAFANRCRVSQAFHLLPLLRRL
jgi:hypothetical protein